MRPRVAVVDYGMGNRRSVQKALEHVGASAPITCERGTLAGCHGLVLPGVGAFPAAMRRLGRLGLDDLIRDRVRQGIPLLGICLGMQLLFEGSEELEPAEGLGLLPGRVTRVEAGGRRIPHIGWSEVRWERGSRLLEGLPAGGCAFYHVHSYAVRPGRQEDVLATTEYGERLVTMVEHGPVAGVQFHPEKSSAHGLRLLRNFVGLCAGAGRDAVAALPSRA